MTSLDDSEIQAINLFIEEAIENPFVESIIMFPHMLKDKSVSINIITIIPAGCILTIFF